MLNRAARFALSLKPSWRQGVLMLATFIVGSAALYTFLFVTKAQEDAALVPAWFDMFQRCQTAIETRQPLFMLGLLSGLVPADPLETARPGRTKMWAPLASHGRFAVEEHEDDTQSGALRTCSVVLADWRRPLTRLEIERLTYAFLENENDRLLKGGYEAHTPSPLPGIVSAGFRSLAPNPAGCPVVSAMFATPAEGEFRTSVGEEGGSCQGGASLMQTKAG